jgi:hypothetical protein
MPNFYRNKWGTVEPVYYENWQTIFDRSVIARLVKTRQDGFLSAGGLLGLGDVEAWDFLSKTHQHQYDVYNNGGKFQTYIAYTSTPGFQGVVFGILDRLLPLQENIKIKLFRAGMALVSAMTFALISIWLGNEFGWLAGIPTLVFVGFSEALIRSAGSIYWNLWVFYLPFMVNTILLNDNSRKQAYPTARLLWLNYFLCLLKILMNGFEGITTFMVMTTVPFIYYAYLEKWDWKTLLGRIIGLGGILIAATVTGLTILSIQIALSEGNLSASFRYIWDAFNRRAIGNPNEYGGLLADSMRASIFQVISKYLGLEAFTFHVHDMIYKVTFLQVILFYAFFSTIFIIRYRAQSSSRLHRKGWSLVIATWYSILAPLSWFIVFKPDAYLHTSIYLMLWHMPFTLLGISVCGFVISDLFTRKTV